MSNNLWEAHNQWANRPADQRFQTLEALRNAVHARRMASRSVDMDITDLTARVGDDGVLEFSAPATDKRIVPVAAEPSHWALGQMAGFLKAPASYLRTLPKDLLVQNLNHGLSVTPHEELKFMTVTREESETEVLQAVNSTRYGRIWDADVADATARIVERTNGRFYNPKAYAQPGQLGGATVPSGLYASDRDIFIFMIDGGSPLDVGERAQLNRGFFMWNSEVGAKTFGLTTFLFNAVCGNHIIWGAQDVNRLVIRHTSGGPARFDSEAAPLLLDYVNASAAPVESAVKKAMEYVLPKTGDERTFEDVVQFANTVAKFTKAEVRGAWDSANREEGDCGNLWQLVQGFTAYARGYDYLDARTDLETRAGKLMALATATKN